MAQYEAIKLTPEGGASIAMVQTICHKLKIPCMSIGTFYDTFKAVNVGQYTSGSKGYQVSPCILYNDAHVFLGYDPRGKYRVIHDVKVLTDAFTIKVFDAPVETIVFKKMSANKKKT